MTDRKSKRLSDDSVSVSGTWYFTQEVNRENRLRVLKECKEFKFDQTGGIDLDDAIELLGTDPTDYHLRRSPTDVSG